MDNQTQKQTPPDFAEIDPEVKQKHAALIDATFELLMRTPPELSHKLVMKMSDNLHIAVKESDNWWLTIKGGTSAERAALQKEMAEGAHRLLDSVPASQARAEIIAINDGVSIYLVGSFN